MSRPASLKGFTLIELLIVIVIIGILSAGAVALFNGAQASARDAKRQGDLSAIQTAIQMQATRVGEGDVVQAVDAAAFNAAIVAGGFLQNAPDAPRATEIYCYYYLPGDTTQFALATQLESDDSIHQVGNQVVLAAPNGTTDFVTTCPAATAHATAGNWSSIVL